MRDVSDTLKARNSTHGDYHEQAELFAAIVKLMATGSNWKRLTNQEYAGLVMAAQKMSRILCGNPHEPDHWHDIAGYATLVERDILTHRTEETDGTDHGILGPVVPESGPVLWRPGDIISK